MDILQVCSLPFALKDLEAGVVTAILTGYFSTLTGTVLTFTVLVENRRSKFDDCKSYHRNIKNCPTTLDHEAQRAINAIQAVRTRYQQ